MSMTDRVENLLKTHSSLFKITDKNVKIPSSSSQNSSNVVGVLVEFSNSRPGVIVVKQEHHHDDDNRGNSNNLSKNHGVINRRSISSCSWNDDQVYSGTPISNLDLSIVPSTTARPELPSKAVNCDDVPESWDD